MPISVYLSARFARKDELRGYRDALAAAGIQCTARWLDGEPQDLADIAAMDREDVLRADVLVAFSEEPVEFSPYPFASRGGRHVEFGMALATGKVCVVVGPREPVFHHARDVRVCATWDECVAMLATLAAASEIGLDEAERKAIALTFADDVEERGW